MKTVLTLLLVAATSALTGCSSDPISDGKVVNPAAPQDSGMSDGAAAKNKGKGQEVGPRGLPVVKEKEKGK